MYDLGDEFHDRGQVDVWLRLSYDPSIVPEEVLEDEVEAPEALSEPANELKVVVVGARVRTQHTRRNKHLLHKDSIEVARDLGMAVADDDAAEEQTLSSFERLRDAGVAAVATLLGVGAKAARRRPSTVDLLGADDLIFDGVACPLTALDLSHNALSHRLGRKQKYATRLQHACFERF